MQIIYKFRVSFEEHDDVVRFIDIESTSSFADFHKIIQESISFDASKAYTFHMSNDFWRLDALICESDTKPDSNLKLPSQTVLNKFINDPHQRFIYSFDPDLDWSFFIELVKIQKAEPYKKYPLLARKEGEAPKQYKLKGKLPGATANLTEYDKMSDMLIASRLMDDLVKPETTELEEEDDLEIDELEIDSTEAKLPEIIKKPIIKEKISIDLKFDEEELSIDSDDLNFLDGEEGDEESKEDDEDDEDYGNNDDSYGSDDGGDDY